MSQRTSDRSSSTPACPAPIVVLERVPRWALAARQALSHTRIVELRALDDVPPTLHEHAHGVLLLEVTPKRAPQVIALLVRLQTEYPHVMTIACVAEASPAWELLLREAGAACVIRSPRRLLRCASWIDHHLQQAPAGPSTLREQLWSQLPWPEAAATASSDA